MLIGIAASLGIMLALSVDIFIPASISQYVAIVLIAAFDSILGAVSAIYEEKFDFAIFITGLLGNAFIAAVLIFIGKRLGIDIYIAAIVVFVMRMFKNFAIIRRIAVEKYEQKKALKTDKKAPETVETD